VQGKNEKRIFKNGVVAMKKCRSYREMISRYIDNDLDLANRTMLNGHFSACRDCRGIADAYTIVRSMVRDYCGEGEFARVTPPQIRHFPDFYPVLRWAASLFFAACLITVFSLHMRHNKTSSPLIMSGTETSSIMNMPLGSIVYYEELAGTTVNTGLSFSQNNAGSRSDKTEAAHSGATGYQSPLFYDNSLLQQRLEMVADQSILY